VDDSSQQPVSRGWLPGLFLGGFAGLVAHLGWPEVFPGLTIGAWAMSGMLWPMAWAYRCQPRSKNLAVFLAALTFAAPWTTFLLASIIGGLTIFASWIWDLLKRAL
jgi:hypothetical protein